MTDSQIRIKGPFVRGPSIPVRDETIRDFFDLDTAADLDKPRSSLGFHSYREAALAHFEKWGMT